MSHTVSEGDTAAAFNSGDVPVLSTPRVLAWCEEASVAVVSDHLGVGETSVGMRVAIDHVQPTAVGAVVTAKAVLARIDGARLTFTVTAEDGRGPIAVGRVTRVVIDRQRFLDRTS